MSRGPLPLLLACFLMTYGCSPPSDINGDSGTDGDGDGDLSPGDGDLDADLDAEADGDSDTDLDADLDGDRDLDSDLDADGESPRECVDELCFDGLDNDCDGEVDEGCACEPDEVASCFTGDPRHRDQGACHDGEMICTGSYEFGEWGPCEGDVTAEPEVCDPEALDEDCDGAANEGCECVEGEPDLACGTDEGVCEAGIQRCIDGRWTECEGAIGPRVETCNGLDDDCDGLVDDDLRRICGSDEGACRHGTETCSEGEWGECLGGNPPSDEVCDALDNDCDGEVDEEVTRLCGSDIGRCVAGIETCSEGEFGPCEGSVGPTGETCNGVDDDCDEETDEELSRPCGTDVGRCVAGVETCVDGGWGDCEGAVWPSEEVCNGEDDDCDGDVDEDDVCPRFPPTVTCPVDETVIVGDTVDLLGGGEDPDGGDVTFAWTVVTRPVGSAAGPEPADEAVAELTPDEEGDYSLRLCATDDEEEVRCCAVVITAVPRCVPPDEPVLTSCELSWDRRPIVEFPPLPAGVIYLLYLEGEPAAFTTIELEGQNYYRPPREMGPGGPPPEGETLAISARACRVDDPTCCRDTDPVTVALIESCDTPIEPTADNIVFSEYVIDGDGDCPGSATCEAGEAIEITNLSHCPVSLDGHHFGYANHRGGAFRWMNFGPGDIIPPRGVYVAIRNRDRSSCDYPFFGPDDPGLFGLRISSLDMEGESLWTGWFNNTGGGASVLRIATGSWTSIDGGTTLEIISPYSGAGDECESVGFNALDACGNVTAVSIPDEVLEPNQLGRLWHPCDAVIDPVPADCM